MSPGNLVNLLLIVTAYRLLRGFPVALVVKNPPANAGGTMRRQEDPLEQGMATHSSILS